MSNKLKQIKQLNKMFSEFISELTDYDFFKDLEVSTEVLKQEKLLVREIRLLGDWEFVKETKKEVEF